jgi:DHA2 family multidrug resistance protein
MGQPEMRDDDTAFMSPAQRWLLLLTVVVTNTLYSSTIIISSTLLPQLQGALLATQDEVSWTMTFNIVASAVATPPSGWLSARMGPRNALLACSVLFGFATMMCGAATSLEEMILWRIVQGAAGAPLVPIGQTLLLDSFPAPEMPTVQSIFGMANMVGPVLGPMAAGYVAEEYGWRWAFWMLLPIVVIAILGILLLLPKDRRRGRAELDWTGFLTLSVAVAAAQLVFSRGQRLDWFNSMEITIATFLAVLALYMYIAHTLTRERSFLDFRLLNDRNFMVGSAMVFVFGALSFAPLVLLPPLLQQQAGYTDAAIGEMVAWRGVGAMLGFFVSMAVQRIDPRVMLLAGACLQTATGLWLASFDLNVSMQELALNTMMQGVCIGLFWAPMALVTFATLPAERRATGMSLFHLLRTFGSSFFISVAIAEILRAGGANYARMTELITPYNRVLDAPSSMGGFTVDTLAGLARIAREIDRQAIMIGYTNAWMLYVALSAAAIPLSFMIRVPRREPKAA